MQQQQQQQLYIEQLFLHRITRCRTLWKLKNVIRELQMMRSSACIYGSAGPLIELTGAWNKQSGLIEDNLEWIEKELTTILHAQLNELTSVNGTGMPLKLAHLLWQKMNEDSQYPTESVESVYLFIAAESSVTPVFSFPMNSSAVTSRTKARMQTYKLE